MLWSPGGKKAGETTAPERGSKRNNNQKEKRILQGRKQKKQEATRGKGDSSLSMKLAMAAKEQKGDCFLDTLW